MGVHMLRRYSNRMMFILLNFSKREANIILICDMDSTSSAPNITVVCPGILFGGCSTNSVEDRQNGDLGAAAP